MPRSAAKPPKIENQPAPNDFDRKILLGLGVLLLVLVTLAAYLPVFQGGFVLDDDVLLTDSPYIQAPDGLYDIWFSTKCVDYWPATNTTLWLEWRLWHGNAAGYHVTNILLHVVESLLLWLILRKLKVPGSYLAALLFAVHPVNVESVAWIASRKNLVAMLFMELSVLCCLRFELPGQVPQSMGRNALWYGLSLVCFILAMLGKGSAVSFPFILLLTIYWLRPLRRSDFLRIIPYLAVAVALGAVNVWFQKHGNEISFREAGLAERFATAGYAVWFYLYKAFLPFNLALVYPTAKINVNNVLWYLPTLAAVLVSLVLFVLQIRCNKTIRPFFFAWSFFLIALVPALGFVDVGFWRYSLVADRYQHLGLIAVVALAASGLNLLRTRSAPQMKFWLDAAAFASVLFLAVLAYNRAIPYHDSVSWNVTALEANPDCWMALNNLANDMAQNRPADAIPIYQRALRLKPDYGNAHQNLGVAYAQTKQIDKAIVELREAVRLQPKYANAHVNLGNAYYVNKQFAEAAEMYEKGLELLEKPSAQVNLCLGDAYGSLGQFEKARRQYKKALDLQPDYVAAWVGLGITCNKAGQSADAVAYFEKARDCRPNDLKVLSLLAMTYAGLERSEEVIRTASSAMQIAREQRNFPLAAQIDKWIDDYRAGLAKGKKMPNRDFLSPQK